MNIPFKQSVIMSAVMLAGATSSPQLLAQPSTTSLILEEVVVTAQKREEGSQDVPISITVMSETDLERRGVVNLGDLISAVPNMGGYEAPGAKGNISINMRGVGGGNPSSLSSDPATAMYIDGVYMGKQIGTSLDVAELERVEVLRGPQGTLYGRNSTGGAVNFITKKPIGEFGGKFTALAGSDDLWGLKGTLHTDTLGTPGEGLGALSASFGAMVRQRDELFENTNPNFDGFDDLDREAYRIALKWDINDQLTVDYAYDHSELDELGTPQFMVGFTPLAVDPTTGAETSRTDVLAAFNTGQIAGGLEQMNQFAPAFGLSPDLTSDRYVDSSQAMLDLYNSTGDRSRPSKASSDIDTYSTNESDGHTLTAALAFDDLGALGSVEFKSITAYRELSNTNFGDLDGTDNSIAAGGAGALNDSTLGAMTAMYGEELSYFGQMAANPALIPALTPLYNGVQQSIALLWENVDEFGGGFFNQNAEIDYEQFSQELQMVGTSDSMEYAVGLYYFSDEGENRSIRDAAIPVGGHEAINYNNETDAWAIYGQTTFRPDMFDERLAITVGYRYTEEEKEVEYLYESAGFVLLPGPFPGTLRTNPNYTGELMQTANYGATFDDDFSNSSGTLTLAYELGDATNIFLRYATGYRSGGFNGDLFNNSYDEETIEQWELGIKSDVIPAVLRVNSSIFAYTYEDQQVSQISVDENQRTSSFIGNAGEAERWGAEIELQWLPLDDLMIGLNYTHMDGDFEEYSTLEGPTITINTDDLARRTQSPDDSASAIVDWVIGRTEWGEFLFHGEVFWQSETYPAALWAGTYANEPYVFDDIVLEESTVVNLRLGLENVVIGNGSLRVGLWGKNITDEDNQTFGINFASLGPINDQYRSEASYGLDITWEF